MKLCNITKIKEGYLQPNEVQTEALPKQLEKVKSPILGMSVIWKTEQWPP